MLQKKRYPEPKRVTLMDVGILTLLALLSCFFVLAISQVVLYIFSHEDTKASESPAKSEISVEEQGINFIRVKAVENETEVILVYRGGGQFELVPIR